MYPTQKNIEMTTIQIFDFVELSFELKSKDTSSTVIATLNYITYHAHCSAWISDKARPFNILERILMELWGKSLETWQKSHTGGSSRVQLDKLILWQFYNQPMENRLTLQRFDFDIWGKVRLRGCAQCVLGSADWWNVNSLIGLTSGMRLSYWPISDLQGKKQPRPLSL